MSKESSQAVNDGLCYQCGINEAVEVLEGPWGDYPVCGSEKCTYDMHREIERYEMEEAAEREEEAAALEEKETEARI